MTDLAEMTLQGPGGGAASDADLDPADRDAREAAEARQ
jgi:hypothetical protein